VRIFLIILGAIFALLGFACGASGVAAYRSVGSDGYVEGGGRMTTQTAALVTDTAKFEKVDDNAGSRAGKVTLRIAAERADGGPVFVAIGTDAAVTNYLADGSSAIVRDLEFGPFDYSTVAQGGTRPQEAPEAALFRVAAGGPGRQEVTWNVEAGAWRAIILNADGSAGVDVQASFAVKFPYLRGFAIAFVAIGGALLIIGVLLIVFQARGMRRNRTAEPPAPAETG
jgi:hypothetical protein